MSTTDDLIKTYSGIFGNLVVARNRNGRTVMVIPKKRVTTIPTVNQARVRRDFSYASRYAKTAMEDAERRAAYAAKARDGMSAYTMAMTDYLKPPSVDLIDASRYQGNPGEKIAVSAYDNFELTGVTLKITDATGTLIEEGPCEFNLTTGNYDFTATVAVPDLAGVILTATATDTPGHTAALSFTL
jgi:hypothetical protein